MAHNAGHPTLMVRQLVLESKATSPRCILPESFADRESVRNNRLHHKLSLHRHHHARPGRCFCASGGISTASMSLSFFIHDTCKLDRVWEQNSKSFRPQCFSAKHDFAYNQAFIQMTVSLLRLFQPHNENLRQICRVNTCESR